MGNNTLYKFSCVVLSAVNPDNLNESFNIKNPYGVDALDVALSKVRLALIACLNRPVIGIIFDIQTEDEEKYTNIVLNKWDLENMSKEEIVEYLRKNVAKELDIQMPKKH